MAAAARSGAAAKNRGAVSDSLRPRGPSGRPRSSLASRSRCRPSAARDLSVSTCRAGSIRAAHLRCILRRSVRGRRSACNDLQAEVRWSDEVVGGDVGGTCCAWLATRRARAGGGRRGDSRCEARRYRQRRRCEHDREGQRPTAGNTRRPAQGVRGQRPGGRRHRGRRLPHEPLGAAGPAGPRTGYSRARGRRSSERTARGGNSSASSRTPSRPRQRATLGRPVTASRPAKKAATCGPGPASRSGTRGRPRPNGDATQDPSSATGGPQKRSASGTAGPSRPRRSAIENLPPPRRRAQGRPQARGRSNSASSNNGRTPSSPRST
jgi:hypothetical protein